jgi:hypothetical protein
MKDATEQKERGREREGKRRREKVSNSEGGGKRARLEVTNKEKKRNTRERHIKREGKRLRQREREKLPNHRLSQKWVELGRYKLQRNRMKFKYMGRKPIKK